MKVMGFERRAPPRCPPSTFTVIGSCIRALLGATDHSGDLAYPAIALLVAAVAVLVGVFLAD